MGTLIDDYRFGFRIGDAAPNGFSLKEGAVRMDLTWEAHDAGPSIDELWLSPRADLSAGFGPWRVRFRQAHLPQISHLRTGDRITVKAYAMGSPFLADIDPPTYRRWFTCDGVLSMSRPPP